MNKVKNVLKFLLIFFILIIVGFLAMIITYALPNTNVQNSSHYTVAIC